MSGGEESTRQRKRPNILVTGTPGVGKTATASLLAAGLGLRHINISELIAQHKCYDGYDNELDTHILDEDKLLDLMESLLQNCVNEGIGIVADYHTCELFPERWFDLILVLRAKTDVLFDRLTERGYSEKKRGENLEAEIMQVVLDEARESYEEDIVQELPSNTVEEMNSNVDRCRVWMEHWIENNNNS